MKKLLIAILFVLVTASGFCAGTTTETSGKSTVQTGPASFTNFVQLGELATPLKCKILTGTTGAAPSLTGYAHGLGDKVVSVSVWVNFTGTSWISTGYTSAGLVFGCYFSSTDVAIDIPAAGTSVAGVPFRALIWYRP